LTDASAAPRHVASRDGTLIAVFSSGASSRAASADRPPLVLIHGTTADHTTFRRIGPRLAEEFAIHAVDRRGRGASGDGAGAYRIEDEFEDIAAVADAVAGEAGLAVAIVGHSYGGRVGLGAALLTGSIGRLVVYEGAPAPAGGEGFASPDLKRSIAELIEAGDRDQALVLFFREVAGMSDEELELYRQDPVWPRRAAAVHTSLRELEAEEASPGAALVSLGRVPIPVLQVLGGDSLPIFHESTYALDARLRNGRVVVIEGARHAAHHTHVDEFVGAIRAFLEDPNLTD
jgi:pimeloyl-ACP methyl ester carboxylesterase